MDMPLWLPFAFFAVALVYSMVGFGGGSSYLALLAVVGLPYETIPQTALVCNLVVTLGGVWHYHRGGHLHMRRVLPFIVLSIPMAYLGGRTPIGRDAFFLLLGLSLTAAGLRAFIGGGRLDDRAALPPRRAWAVGLPIGAGLGLLSGLVGIGGGVFLAPVLLVAGWFSAKETAAAASVFIVLNSAAGLAGQFHKGIHLDASVLLLALAVLVGGQIGSRTGSYRLAMPSVRRLLATLILVIGVRLIWRVL